jgi:hypothetical protein
MLSGLCRVIVLRAFTDEISTRPDPLFIVTRIVTRCRIVCFHWRLYRWNLDRRLASCRWLLGGWLSHGRGMSWRDR